MKARKPWKKAACAALSAVMALSLTACQSAGQAVTALPAVQQQAFDDFLMQDFIQTMESEYTALHVYLQDPADVYKRQPARLSRCPPVPARFAPPARRQGPAMPRFALA